MLQKGKELLLSAAYRLKQNNLMFHVIWKTLGTDLGEVASCKQPSIPVPSVSVTKGCLNHSWKATFSFSKSMCFFFKQIPLTYLDFLERK